MATSVGLHGSSALKLTEGLVSFLKEQRPEYLPEVLVNYREHGLQIQGQNGAAGLVGFSNTKLSSSKTRFEGLCLLSMLVKDSTSDLFQQHCLFWLRSLQQIIQSQAPVQTIQLAVNILKDLLQYSCQLAELAREVGLNSILGILTSLLGLKTECELAAMEGMVACMVFYPRACGSLKDKLRAYFISKMDSNNKKTQEMACLCYSHLPCVGGLLDRAVSAGKADGWTNQIHCLLATADGLLSQIYKGSEPETVVEYQGPGVELAFPYLDPTETLQLLRLQQRYTAVCRAVKHTLRVDPASAVRLPVKPVLNLVCRALAVNAKNASFSADGSLMLLILPSIHCNTLEMLSDLITVVRSSMVPYAAIIQRLFSQTLSAWTPVVEAGVGRQRGYSSVRVSVYKTLELWVKVVGASVSILQENPMHADLLFNNLLGDITPGPESIKLRAGLGVDVVPGGKPGPRRTKHLVIADPMGPSLQRKGDPLSNQDTCLAALRALRQIIQTCGTLIKEDIHKRLHEVVLPLCVCLQQQKGSSSVFESTGAISGQYSSALARRELYRLLLALVLVPSPSWPPPLTCAVSIFSNGRTDRNLKVSSFCAEALTICNTIVHPRTHSIALPLPPLTLRPSASAPVLSPQGSAPRLTLPTLLEGHGSGPPFPSRQSLNLGPSSLLSSLENHLSTVPGLPAQAPTPGDLFSPHPHQQHDSAGLGLPESQRPVFVRFDKEEPDDVEISLASDSDDSVVIVPPGMITLDNQQDEAAANPQTMLSAAPAGSGVTLPVVESNSMVPITAATTTIDVSTLPNDLPTSSSLLTTSASSINSFPPPSASAATLPPALNSSIVSDPHSDLGDSLPCKPQLQQMLMQTPTSSQGSSMGLPLQMHQLQNQLTQQGRLHQQLPAPPSNEDSTIININSTDDEDEEEDLEDDEELEEEEEGLDEEDEEEGSDDFYDGEEYEDYDEEEGEELEEEEEEEENGDMPPLEGSEEKLVDVAIEEGQVLHPAAAADEKVLTEHNVEADSERGIQELQPQRTMLGEERVKLQEVESIGVLEDALVGVEEEDESERMDDPTMPQIICVSGGAQESIETGDEGEGTAHVLQEDTSNQPAKEDELKAAPEEQTSFSAEEPEVETAQEDESSSSKTSDQPAELPAAAPEEPTEAGQQSPADLNTGEQQEENQASEDGEQPKDGEEEEKNRSIEPQREESDKEEAHGTKRKREEELTEEAGPSTEKKKVDDEAMASMLADFVACPPDDEAAPGSTCS
ncbi:proline-, glutamic acid- and leucine-rich protein 1 isoform X2 [Oryzias melastigma]|uniref:proline-, glutamic acid- and leucine-rich protein 1 isoform X2 n=1 Tax=Oryzias melastigma TaxID=30732 RepID=UPI000CF7BA8F|nr:proline-, glutamic acid- and leucine-rich protein 1 isoform X2 [Oryzias melastigma]